MTLFIANFLKRCRSLSVFWVLTGLFVFLPFEAAPALKIWPDSLVSSDFPEEFGEIVYRKNPDSPCQVFIVANSHRSPFSGANGDHTVQAQFETFRIGEWLIRHKKVELLLPEGFFGEPNVLDRAYSTPFDGKILKNRLSDTSVFINAELLLHENYGIRLGQVEDRLLYNQVKKTLCEGLETGALYLPSFGRHLEYLQKRRSVAILQSLPEVIETELQQGKIASPCAMLTIGLSHLDEILSFLENGGVQIAIPTRDESSGRIFSSDLELLKKEVGVTIIIPRTLMKQFADFAVHNPV